MPRNKWRGCGRRDGGEHESVFKYRIKTNELWESCYKPNYITQLEQEAQHGNTIFFLFFSNELSVLNITTWSLKKKNTKTVRTSYKFFIIFLLNLMSLF